MRFPYISPLSQWRQLWNIKGWTSEPPEKNWELTAIEKMAMKSKYTSNSLAIEILLKHITKHYVNYCSPSSPVFSKHSICRAIALANVLLRRLFLFRNRSKSQHLEPASTYPEKLGVLLWGMFHINIFSSSLILSYILIMKGIFCQLQGPKVLGPQNRIQGSARECGQCQKSVVSKIMVTSSSMITHVIKWLGN